MTTPLPIMPMLFTGFDYIWDRLWSRLDGLSQDEYLWTPAEPSWTIRETADGWLADFSRDEVTPAPITTIAWRMWHIGSTCLSEYVSPALGDWPLPVRGRQWYGEVGLALEAMQAGYTAFAERVRALGEDGLRSKLGPDWGPFAEDSWADLVVHAIDELAHHGAEIALLRDLYPALGTS